MRSARSTKRPPSMWRCTCCAVIVMGALITNAVAQQLPGDQLVSFWLNLDCTFGDVAASVSQQLTEAGDTVTPALIAAALNGPDPFALAGISVTSGATFDGIQADLASGDNLGLASDDVLALQSESRDEVISDEVSSYVSSYRRKAVAGLAVVGTNSAMSALQEFVSDGSDPILQQLAQEALDWKASLTKIAPTISFTGAPTTAAFQTTFAVIATTNATSTATIIASGACSISGNTVTMTSGTGVCIVSASWAADSTYSEATATQSITATKTNSNVTIASVSPTGPVFGQSVTVSYQLSTTGSPTGSATVTADSGENCTATINSPAGSCILVFGSAGSHSLSATYTGDGNYLASNSTSYPVTIGKEPTKTSLAPSANPSYLNRAVTFTVNLSATAEPVQPTGMVMFYDGSIPLGSAIIATGVATLTTSSLTVGSHTISAAYNGDGNYEASAATALVESIKTLVGDLNGDGVVNCADLAIIKASFGKKTGQTGFDPRADVNGDGIVNLLDLSAVAKQVPAGTVCQ